MPGYHRSHPVGSLQLVGVEPVENEDVAVKPQSTLDGKEAAINTSLDGGTYRG